MKTGAPTRLAEKLNQEMDEIREQHRVSLQSQLKSFESDLKNIARVELRTIENDTQAFLAQNREYLGEVSLEMQRTLRTAPRMVIGTILACLCLIALMTWFLAVKASQSELNRMGMTLIEQNGTHWIIPDPARTHLRSCTMAGQPITCFEITEN